MQDISSGFSLRPGVSFCLTNERAIFLDQIADRYLALPECQDQALRRLSDGLPANADDARQLAALVDQGLLVHAVQGGSLEACAQSTPAGAIAPSHRGKVPARTQWIFAWRVSSARRRLRRHGLYKTLHSLRLFRLSRSPITETSTAKLREAADLLAQIGRYVTRLDQCLPISLGLADHLLQQGIDCQVVLGVQLGPFQAHCWVQCGDQLVGDDLDIVRTFTPILVV